jgi:hypothetical protein
LLSVALNLDPGLDPAPSQREPLERGAAKLNLTLAVTRICDRQLPIGDDASHLAGAGALRTGTRALASGA